MSLFTASLNSGSNGNCYYIGNEHEAVLIDAGISCREIEKRMGRLGLPMARIKAIFISHEHSDHICGVETLVKKHKLPVYITPQTLQNGSLQLDGKQVIPFSAYQKVCIGDLCITAFPKQHDAIEPHSFIVSCHDINIGVFTDIGEACEHVIFNFGQCHAAFLEANYDDDMLRNGRYPYHLKRRIFGSMGHLSNKQALDIFTAHKPAYMSHLFLSHLSKDNNSPQLVQQLFDSNADGVTIIVASRYAESSVYYISDTNAKSKFNTASLQFTLF